MASQQKQKKKNSIIMKQPIMARMLYALTPIVVVSIYYFGWRTLLVFAVVNITGFLAEYLFARVYKQKVSMAVFVTNFLFALSLPPTIPIWIAVVGIIFGVVFGKMVFGGFGRNVFNPALTGRAFIYVSFVVPMTSTWRNPIEGLFGGFAKFVPDAVTQATPLRLLAGGGDVSVLNLFIGNVAGSVGETSAIIIIIAAIYLLWKKTASYRIMLSGLAGFLLFQTLFWLMGVKGVPEPIHALLAGSFLFGIVFMATDPISASQTTDTGRWIYGALIGVLTSLIRTFSVWPEGITFAILFANMFAPLLDYIIKNSGKKKVKAS